MRRHTPIALAATLAASLALTACNAQTEDTADLPEPQVSGTADPVSGAEIDAAVPGVEGATPEGSDPNTADISTEENLDTAEPGDPEPQ